MFSGDRHSSVSDKNILPRLYLFFTLGNEDLELEVSVSDTSINSIRISNLSETVTAMYPLLQPSLENLADQICKSQSLDHLTLSSDSPYTSQLLLNTIRDALKKLRQPTDAAALSFY